MLEVLLKNDKFKEAIEYITITAPMKSIEDMIKLYLIKSHLVRVIELQDMLAANTTREICKHLMYVADLIVELKEY